MATAAVAYLGHGIGRQVHPFDSRADMGRKALREVYARQRRHCRGKRGKRTLCVYFYMST